jgi:hypothetical protein
VPVLAWSVEPTIGVPLIDGMPVAVGDAPAETTPVGAEFAVPDPAEFDAVTVTRTVAPASATASA